ncbi:hypothetical protein M1D88_18075 [Arthrobacter sp. R1-13]
MKRMIAKVTPVVLLGLALAACSSPQAVPAPASPSAGAVTTQEAKGEQKPSNPGTGIIKNTTMTSCDTKEGDVTAAGTVTLPENVEGTIEVSVSWVDPKTSSVLAKETKTIDDAPTGQAIDWSLKSKLGKLTTDVKCVLGSTVLPAG